MKRTMMYLLVIFGCIFTAAAQQKVVFEPSDKKIVQNLLSKFSEGKNTATAELTAKIGIELLNTPYVAHTLEIEPEQLVVNLRELDCTTFAENCLALARTIKSGVPTFEKFCAELQNIRYYSGEIKDYTSRIHYFSDWIFENNQRKFIKDISEEIAKNPYSLKVNFMSTHPGSYVQLKDSTLIPVIAKKEKEISARTMFYIPEEKLAEFENLLQNGDIAGITTSIKGMDISHVVILRRISGKIHILHASLTAKMVILSEETLEDYLKSSNASTGIMVARPL